MGRAMGMVLVGVGVLALAAPGCAGETADEGRAGVEGRDGGAAAACPPPATSGPAAPPEGIELPPNAVVEGVQQDGATVTATGRIGSNPVDIKTYYEAKAGIEVKQIEDEGFEMEALVTNGTHRTFVKAESVCPGQSRFTAVVAAEAAEG